MSDHPFSALIIGVDDYSALDASLGRQEGSSDLRGAINDAIAWARLCRELGVPDDQIVLMTWPRLGRADLRERGLRPGGIRLRAATAEHLERALGRLARWLGADQRRGGLLFAGGHGVFKTSRDGDAELSFCAGDARVRGEALEGAVSLREGLKQVGRLGGAGNLTTVLDCCHAPRYRKGPGGPLIDHLSDVVDERPDAWGAVGHRIMAACGPKQSSAEAEFEGVWRGAFSWAMLSALSQWRLVPSRGVTRSTVSHERLRGAAQGLLDALAFRQTTAFSGLEAIGALPVFNPDQQPRWTSPQPDRADDDRQISGGDGGFRLYQFDRGVFPAPANEPTMGLIVATNTGNGNGNYETNREYIRLDGDAIGAIPPEGFTVWVFDCDWERICEAPFPLHPVAQWEPDEEGDPKLGTVERSADEKTALAAGQLPTGTGLYHRETSGQELGVTMRFDLSGPEPVIRWFHEADGFLFEPADQPGADFKIGGDGVVTTAHRMVFRPGSTAQIGWTRFGNVILGGGQSSVNCCDP